MLVGSRIAAIVTQVVLPALLVLSAAGGCSKRDLQLGGGPFDLDAGGGSGGTDAGATDVGPGDGGLPAIDGGLLPTDAGESACVTAAIPLPWMKPSVSLARLDVATTADTVAVMNRDGRMLDVRTYTRDGTIVGGFQFAADAQFLPYRDGRYLLMTRGVTGGFSATAIDPDLVAGDRLYGAAASATEHMRGAIVLATSTVVITDERFVNIGGGGSQSASWSTVLGAADAGAFATGRLFGLAAQNGRVLIAWGMNEKLRLAVLDSAGSLVARADDDLQGGLGGETATAIPWDDGLLLFHSNDVRLTKIGFDLSRPVLGENQQLRTFYRTAPRVAAIGLGGRPIAFWLTVFPQVDNSQGFTTHQLYGCELDLGAPESCVATSLIAATGLGGYDIAAEPLAAAAFPDGVTFAIAHTDVNGRSWLRIANLGCASRTTAP